jgi:hypothetical protein
VVSAVKVREMSQEQRSNLTEIKKVFLPGTSGSRL